MSTMTVDERAARRAAHERAVQEAQRLLERVRDIPRRDIPSAERATAARLIGVLAYTASGAVVAALLDNVFGGAGWFRVTDHRGDEEQMFLIASRGGGAVHVRAPKDAPSWAWEGHHARFAPK